LWAQAELAEPSLQQDKMVLIQRLLRSFLLVVEPVHITTALLVVLVAAADGAVRAVQALQTKATVVAMEPEQVIPRPMVVAVEVALDRLDSTGHQQTAETEELALPPQ